MTDEELRAIPQVRAALQDEMSRDIYRHRLLYSLTGDYGEIQRLVREHCLPDLPRPGGKVCLYGAGLSCAWYLRACRRGFPFVIDTHKRGELEGVPVISPGEFRQRPDWREFTVLVAVQRLSFLREVCRDLDRLGLPYVTLFAEHRQYFDLPALALQEEEWFADVGALDGDSSVEFFGLCPRGHAYVFEPDPGQAELTRDRLRGFHEAEVFSCGLYDRDGTVRFRVSGAAMPAESQVAADGGTVVPVRRLDSLIYGDGAPRPVTYVKMDIEGSELAALRGAVRTIREQRPRLAICVYHKPEDLWQIPALLLRCHPGYRLYLRHYSMSDKDTVLYALP